MASKGTHALAVILPTLVMAACGGAQAPALVVPGTATDLGLSPKGMQGATYSLVARGDGIKVLTVDEERMQLRGYDASGAELGTEVLLNLQPELWNVDESLLEGAVMSFRFEDLPTPTLEGCLRAGRSEMSRHIFVYGGGLVDVGDGFGVVFGARANMECDEAGAPTTVSVEHIIVFDTDFNRVQHDTSLWIEKVPMDAVTAVDGQAMRAAWLVSDGVYVGGSGVPPSRSLTFTSLWSEKDPPVHFFIPTPDTEVIYALGLVERPMASVGQGESYLVMHIADRDDPSDLKVSRLALPDHPQSVAGAWADGRVGVSLFAEVRPPHAESRARVYFVEFDRSATAQADIATVLEWKSVLGKSFGMQAIVMSWRAGTYAAALQYDQGMGGMIDLITIASGGARPRATHDMGWQDAKDLRILPSGDDFLILWSDKVVRMLRISPPYGVPAAP